jgi:mono/diheme cytochrome c family protein
LKGFEMKLRYIGILAIFSMLSMAAYAVGSDKTPEKIVVAADDSAAVGADGFRLPEQKVKSTAAEIPPMASDKSPHDVALTAEKGALKNPYNYKPMNQDLVAAGRKKYMSVSCNGCHGGNGGGGMCPPLSNATWVYGADDDTLFRLVALGSDELMKQGYTRKGRENVVGPMPAHGKLIKTEDDLWRIIYFIRGNFRGEEKDIKW